MLDGQKRPVGVAGAEGISSSKKSIGRGSCDQRAKLSRYLRIQSPSAGKRMKKGREKKHEAAGYNGGSERSKSKRRTCARVRTGMLLNFLAGRTPQAHPELLS